MSIKFPRKTQTHTHVHRIASHTVSMWPHHWVAARATEPTTETVIGMDPPPLRQPSPGPTARVASGSNRVRVRCFSVDAKITNGALSVVCVCVCAVRQTQAGGLGEWSSAHNRLRYRYGRLCTKAYRDFVEYGEKDHRMHPNGQQNCYYYNHYYYDYETTIGFIGDTII